MDVRNYINILIATLLLGVTSSCSQDDGMNAEDNQKNVTLTLSLGQQASGGARVADPGLDNLNENLMQTVDLFFYRETAKSDEAAVFSKSMTLPTNTLTSATVSMDIPVSKFKQLFPNDDVTKCQVYAIVNRPNENTLPAELSIASLKNSIILHAPNFKVKNQAGTGPSKQDIFVMDGFSNAITRTGLALTGNIPVERVAAKISLIINDIETVVQKDNNGNEVARWNPVPESVRISLCGGSVRTKLGSTPTEYIYSATKADLFTMNDVSLENEGKTTNYPFYTYPTNWLNDENARTHFTMVVEWQKEGDSSAPKPTYYQVSVNNAGSYTQRNRHYKITQEISVLGSEDSETPIVLYPSSYIVLPWGNAHGDASGYTDSDGDLSRFRYLVVDETNVEMDNISSKQIYFFSSDPVDLSSVDVKWDYTAQETSQILPLATLNNSTRTVDPITKDITYVISNDSEPVSGVTNRIQNFGTNHDYRVTIKIHNANMNDPEDRSYIYVEHKLNNNMSQDADYTSYYMNLVVKHSDNASYNETIKITQYPMIVIKADINSNWADTNPNSNKGYVYVNARTGNDNSSSYIYGNTNGIGTGTNQNPNRYIITVKSLPDTDVGKKFIIGDPRESTVNNLGLDRANTNASRTSPTMNYTNDTSNRKIKYYHPTSETKSNVISPEFMIASSYGKTSSESQERHQMRCATYQEDGYPAGRWRLPTQAEIEYIVQLSAWGKIPTLFGTPGEYDYTYYWSSSGVVGVNPGEKKIDTETSKSEAYVRCVYDTWYWTDKCNKTTFTWGDKFTF